MKSARTNTIGVLLEDSANQFSSALHRALGDLALINGYDVLSGSLDESPALERRLATNFVARGVDGLVVVPAGHDHRYLADEIRAGLAVVFVDRPPERLDADAVLADNRQGSRRAVLRLIRRGHRRIAFMGDDPGIWTANERFAGYREALERGGAPYDEALIRHAVARRDAAASSLGELLADPSPPTAIFAAQNTITVGVVKGLRDAGLSHKIALIGFDDFALSDMLDPPVTVVAQNPRRMGMIALAVLLRRLAGDTSPASVHVVETTLIERGSGEILPGPPS